jgi:hypothetical protein
VTRRDTLRDGTVRLTAAGGAFLFLRLAPRVLLLSFRGRDEGQLANAPFAEMAAELERFGPPLRLFADARAAQGVGPLVQDQWTGWFSARRAALAGVDVLVPHAVVQLAMTTVGHFARTGGLMRITGDAAAFESAVRVAAPDFAGLPSPARFDEAALDVRRETGPDGAVRLHAGRCRFEYRRPRPRLVSVTISGHDDGALGAAPLDELMPDLQGRPGRLLLFVDARATLAVATHVRDLWSAWFQAHRDRLEAVHVLPGSRIVELNVGLGRQLSRTGSLMRVHADAREFDRALAEAG